MSFAAALKENLEHVAAETTFEVYDIKSKFSECSAPLFKEQKGSTSSRHRLILVSTASNGFICGLETYEYEIQDEDSVPKIIVYISKVDTSSTFKEYKGLTARIVQAYISSLPSYSTVFVFARAQPQYLFAESANNKDKSILSDRELVSWWLYVLNKVKLNCKGYWFVPGIDESNSALIEIGARRRGWTPSESITWHYGTPFDPEANAALSIPRFEDDAKSRLLKNTENEQEALTVKDFFSLLSIGEECGSGKITGFFKLELTGQQHTAIINGKDDMDSIDSNRFTVFWNKFMCLNFQDEDNAKDSTETAKKEMKKIIPHLQPIKVESKLPTASTTTSPTTTNSQATGTSINKRPAVNVLSMGCIKRKKH